MLPALALVLVVAPVGSDPFPSLATDAGFTVDGGSHWQVIDSSSTDAGGETAAASPMVMVRVNGAKVLPAEVYLDLIHLPDHARPDEPTARVVQGQVLSFLLRTGFELATVGARVTDFGIELDVDEGQVERVLFFGQMSFQMVRFKLALLLPNEVFNRPLLDRQVRELAAAAGVPGVRWELVRSSRVVHAGPQITQLPSQMDMSLQGAPAVHERRPYELHIIFPEWEGSGLGIDVRSTYADGLEGGINYRRRELLLADDRLYAGTSGGVGLRSRLDGGKLYAHFSRAALELRYDTYQWWGHLRPNVWAQGELLARQRPDLQLENYYALTVATALDLELEIRKGFSFQVGAGFEWRRLFDFEETGGAPLSADVFLADRKRPFIRATHESVVDPTVVRWERRHTLESEFRLYFPLPSEPGFAWVDLRYQYVRPFGWNDFWVKSRGHLAVGDVTFHDEVSEGELLRGLFGGTFVPAAVALQLEYRVSITRDLLKVSLFHDLAMFAVRPVRGEPTLVPQVANGFGPGLHFLAQDLFQLDLYLAFGFRQRGAFGASFLLQIRPAF